MESIPISPLAAITITWQYVGSRISTPANAAKLRILLYNYMNSGWVAYDDIELRKMETYTLSYDAENRMVGMAGGKDALPDLYAK